MYFSRLGIYLRIFPRACGCSTAPSDTLFTEATAAIDAHKEHLIALRRRIHRYPELSGEEVRTSALVAERLEALGFEVRRKVGGHSVVGYLKGSNHQPLIAFRSDLDAIRTFAPDPVSFASERGGIRHGCGHDIYTTIGPALAEGFAAIRGTLTGSVLLIFQAEEETVTGAAKMLEAGVFADHKPTAIFGVHTAPFEIGTLVTASERMMVARGSFEFSVSGEGAEVASTKLDDRVRALNTISSPIELYPVHSSFIYIDVAGRSDKEGTFAKVSGMTSIASDTVRAFIKEKLQALSGAIRNEYPALKLTLTYKDKASPGVLNNPALVSEAVKSARKVTGEHAVHLMDQVYPAFGEDFGWFQYEVPGVFFFLGVNNSEKGTVGFPHSPYYVADEGAIGFGAKVMTKVMLDQMIGAHTEL